ncbi:MULTISPECIES: hypothetical protein [unclassified Marinomonas]|uniref:hypothetical protein n=1 Tax=unclassified Marinomonas TaxID=196814 RepID=UPI000A79B9A0|nr:MULTISPECIES: hypothetical protein [unclassified Marinomonas]
MMSLKPLLKVKNLPTAALTLASLLSLNYSSALMADEYEDTYSELTGYGALEARYFPQDALYSGQDDSSLSTAFNLEYYRDWDDGNKRFVATTFGRYDEQDSERSHLDIRELYVWRGYQDYEVYAGVRKVFWGVTETLHLVDIVNQDDAVEDIDGEDKLGQPMLSVLMERDWGTFEAFALFGFRERTFTGSDGRLRSELRVDTDAARYQSSREDEHIDFAARWSQVYGDWDVGLSQFIGTSRDPQFQTITNSSNQVIGLAPYYAQIQQTGLDVQAIHEDWLFKLEGISIKYKGDDRNTAAVGGFEYTYVGINESVSDLGVFVEYQFDDRHGDKATVNQNDLALGTRWVLNDIEGTEVISSISFDLDNQSQFISLEGSRRLNDDWFIETQARVFTNTDTQDSSYQLRNDDYIQVEVRRYF